MGRLLFSAGGYSCSWMVTNDPGVTPPPHRGRVSGTQGQRWWVLLLLGSAGPPVHRQPPFRIDRDYRVGQSREIYSNSVPLSPPHWPYPKRIRPPSWPRVAVASSIQNTKLFTWRTWPGAGAVPKCDWAARSQCGFKQRRADHTKYI